MRNTPVAVDRSFRPSNLYGRGDFSQWFGGLDCGLSRCGLFANYIALSETASSACLQFCLKIEKLWISESSVSDVRMSSPYIEIDPRILNFVSCSCQSSCSSEGLDYPSTAGKNLSIFWVTIQVQYLSYMTSSSMRRIRVRCLFSIVFLMK